MGMRSTIEIVTAAVDLDTHVRDADLVITGDIPLAAQVLEKGAMALNPRGERYTPDTIRERLALRDMMEELRAGGVDTGGPASFSHADRKAFANQLDALLSRAARQLNKT